MSVKRLAPSAVLAIGVTALIGLGMAAMIKSEFTPQEKSEKLTFEINPVPDDILPTQDRLMPEQVRRVETPPPPPKICLLYTSPSPRDQRGSRMPSSA